MERTDNLRLVRGEAVPEKHEALLPVSPLEIPEDRGARASGPDVLKIIARFDPLSYGIDAMRILLIGVSAYDLTLDVLVLAATAAVFLGLGSYFFSKIR